MKQLLFAALLVLGSSLCTVAEFIPAGNQR
jgi:hypothetical protein